MRPIRLTLSHVTTANREHKFVHAVEELAKAMGIRNARLEMQWKEPLLPVLEGFATEVTRELEDMNRVLLAELERWMGAGMQKAEGEWKLPDAIIYSPKTGQPFTQAEWNRIGNAIDKFMASRTGDTAQRIAQTGAALGGLTSRLSKVRGIEPGKLGWAELKKKLPRGFKLQETAKQLGLWKTGWEPYTPVQFRTDNIATYVVEVSERTRNEIKRILNDGLREQKGTKQITQELFDSLHAKNRDWERIARTEVQNSYQDGALATELGDSEPGEKVYMIGQGSAGACPVCQRDVIGKVVVLLPNKAGGDQYVDDPVTNVAIWPGKTSVGHKAKESWACVTRHPHCGCRWTRYYPRPGIGATTD